MANTHHGILIHVVFSTKYRKPLINDDWQDELFGYIGGIAKNSFDSQSLVSGGIEDHVHLLLKIHPRYSISKIIQTIKSNSSRWINEKRKFDCKFEWQRGYGAFSVSQSMSDSVSHYIRNQRQHHEQQSFEQEYLAILRKHQIHFERKFVFDQQLTG